MSFFSRASPFASSGSPSRQDASPNTQPSASVSTSASASSSSSSSSSSSTGARSSPGRRGLHLPLPPHNAAALTQTAGVYSSPLPLPGAYIESSFPFEHQLPRPRSPLTLRSAASSSSSSSSSSSASSTYSPGESTPNSPSRPRSSSLTLRSPSPIRVRSSPPTPGACIPGAYLPTPPAAYPFTEVLPAASSSSAAPLPSPSMLGSPAPLTGSIATAAAAAAAAHTMAQQRPPPSPAEEFPPENFPVAPPETQPAEIVDDEGLTTLERIYIYARSDHKLHRLYILQNLPNLLMEVAPQEAVDYVLPLLPDLAVDEDDEVKGALAGVLASIMWWFLTNCFIVDEHNPSPDDVPMDDMPVLTVQSFTPILGTLLLSSAPIISAPARHTVVDLLARVREAEEAPAETYPDVFDAHVRKMIEDELLQQVVIGMGRLDFPQDQDWDNDAMAVDDAGATPIAPTDALKLSADMVPLPETPIGDVLKTPDATHIPLPISQPPTPLIDHTSEPWNVRLPPTPVVDIVPSLSPDAVTPRLSPVVEPGLVNPYFPNLETTMNATMASTDPSTPEFTASPQPMFTLSPSPSGSSVPDMISPHSDVSSPTPSPGDVWSPVTPPQTVESAVHVHQGSGDSSTLLPAWSENSPPTAAAAGAGYVASQSPAPASDAGGSVGINEEEAAALAQEASEQAAVGRLASMSLIAAVTAAGPLTDESKLAFVQEVERIGRDQVWWVRRESAFALGALAKVVSAEVVQTSLVPLFRELCHDETWHVRHSALFALPAMVPRLSPSDRRKLSLDTLLWLSGDETTNVRSGVLEALGEVIHSFLEDAGGPPEELLRLFLGRPEDLRWWEDWLTENRPESLPVGEAPPAPLPTARDLLLGMTELPPPPRTVFEEPARALICAFNFPAVTLTLGRDRWPFLRETYLALAASEEPKIRRTLAASVGEMAKILGAKDVERNMITIWQESVVHADADVRLKAMESLEILVQSVPVAEAVDAVRSLARAWSDGLKWREKEAAAKILVPVAVLLKDKAESISPVLKKALTDNAAAVKEAAVASVPQLLKVLTAHVKIRRRVLTDIAELAKSNSYRYRMTYVACQQACVLAEDGDALVADDSFWKAMTVLSTDGIVNVRIGVSRLVGIICDRFYRNSISIPGYVLDIVIQLANDSSADVRSYVSVEWRTRQPLPAPVTSPDVLNFSRPPPSQLVQSTAPL